MEKWQAHHRQRFLAHRTVHLTPDWVGVAFEAVLVVAAVELHSVVNDFVTHSTLEICFVANTKNGCIVPRHSLFRFWGKCAQKSDLFFYREAIWTFFSPAKILLVIFWRFASMGNSREMRITHLRRICACDLIVRLSLERENILELQKCFAKVYFRELLLAFWGTREARNLHQTTRLTLVQWFLVEKGAREWGQNFCSHWNATP